MSKNNILYINPTSGTLAEKVSAIIAVLNTITEQMTETTVPGNKAAAEQQVNAVYDALPLSIVAEMIEEKVMAAKTKLEI